MSMYSNCWKYVENRVLIRSEHIFVLFASTMYVYLGCIVFILQCQMSKPPAKFDWKEEIRKSFHSRLSYNVTGSSCYSLMVYPHCTSMINADRIITIRFIPIHVLLHYLVRKHLWCLGIEGFKIKSLVFILDIRW